MGRIAQRAHHLRWVAVVTLLAVLPAVAVQPVGAATGHVTTCNSSGTGSLPAVVTAAIAGDTIVFDLDCPATGPITLTTQITIGKNLTIDGTGRTVVVSGGNTTRHFTVNNTFTLSLANLTLQNGNPGVSNPGGSINNNGTLNVTGCTFSNNVGGGTSSTDGGGAIHNNGTGTTLTVVNSTFASNRTVGSGDGGAIRNVLSPNVTITGSTFTNNTSASGGAIRMTGTVAIANSTFTGNRGTGGAGTFLLGTGAVTLTLKNVTVAGNSSGGSTGTGGIETPGGTTTVNLTNTIVAGNTGASSNPDVKGAFTSGGHNLIGVVDGGTGFIGTDLTGTAAAPLDAKLGPLANNGGPTQTMAPLFGSPAITAGDPAVCAAAPVGGVDQRSTARPATFCTIGAFESLLLPVTTCADSGAGSLRNQAAAAPANYTLFFTVNCTSSSPLGLASQIIIGKNLTIDGTGHTIVINGGNTTRLFTVNSTFTLGLTRLLLRSGNAGTGGNGGAVLNNGTLTVTECSFTSNTSDGSATNGGGGAIYNNSGTVTITDGTFVGNTAGASGTNSFQGGGAIYNFSGTLTIADSIFSANSTGSTNPAGGAIQTRLGTVNITGSIFTGNSTGGTGGALDNNRGTVTVANSTLTGNSAAVAGGMDLVNGGTTTLKNVTITSNSVALTSGIPQGGGVRVASGTMNVTNSIVAGNTGPTAPNGPDAAGTFASGGHNLIGKMDGSTGFTGPGDLTGTNAAPLDPKLGPLASNGGPTQTHALLPDSPATGAGDPAICAAAPVGGVEQRGSPRPATSCAIGAYEPPFIASISPNPGGAGGGNHAILTGGGYFSHATVTFGGNACTDVAVTSPSTLTCIVPAGSGTVSVSVTAGGGTGTQANAYTYTTVNPLPSPEPPGGPPGGPNPLPNSRPSGGASGSPAPIPQPRSA